MRILMISGVAGKAEAGAAGVVHNLTKELRDLGHSVSQPRSTAFSSAPLWITAGSRLVHTKRGGPRVFSCTTFLSWSGDEASFRW
jgi:hypothetical protein